MESYEGLVSRVEHELASIRDSMFQSAGQRMALYGIVLGETRSRDIAVKSYVTLNNAMKECRSANNSVNLCAYRNDNIGYFEDSIPLFFVEPWALDIYTEKLKDLKAKIMS